jgi:hypothetical protein
MYSYNHLVAAIGVSSVFYIFTVMWFLTSIFCYFFLPETKGLPIDVIQLLFTKKKDNAIA